MTYEIALQKINSLLRFGVKPGLERVEKLLTLLGNPQDSLKFVHVAGTNGKGSTCALIASVLRRSRYKTGLFTSPYVTDFCERMQINGEMIPREDLIALVAKIFPLVEQMAKQGQVITEFEFITALAMQWFAQNQCDIVVLEVGLGGRQDATNVIKTPLVSVITSISLDHTAVLGDTVEKIAYEKCGIIKEGGVTVCYPDQQPTALELIRKIAEERHNRFVLARMDSVEKLSSNLTGTGLEYRGLLVRLPFLGDHQVKNAVTALAALEVLKEHGWHISDHSFESGFSSAVFPARLEVLSDSPLVLLDGAHNPDGTKALALAIKKYLGGRKIVAVMGMLADKDVTASVQNLAGVFTKVFTLTPENARSMHAEELAAHWYRLGTAAQAENKVDDALNDALKLAGSGGAVVVFGSLYLAGEVRPRLLKLLKK
ncbi:MAG TPA: folylpolyglutamate synthase/dihydrofolate synthase family protein [Caproiciproducens sp.]|nr:folylpolyglutamate synthase/dihydrofolate synthase family protein [Caproiciproducens sp.]